MAGTKKLDDLKSKIEDLRSVVTGGFERLVEHELNGLKKHYKEVQKSLKAARKAGDVKKAAKMQLDMLQSTMDRILANLHETAGIVSDTRDELVKLTEVKPAKKAAAKPAAAPAKKPAAAPAKKTTAKASTAAKKTTARASTAARKTATKASTAAKKTSTRASTAAKKTATRASTAAKKTTARASTAAKTTAAKAATTAKSATAVKPSPTSRVKRATSKGKATTGPGSASS